MKYVGLEMNEKKVVSRSVAFALTIIIVTLSFSLAGVTVNYTFIVSEKDDVIASLNSQVTSLQNNYSQLTENYSQLSLSYSQLTGNYDALNATYTWLQITYSQLQANYSKEMSLRIGTTLETYYDYVRANVMSLGGEPLGEEKWYEYPNYYSDSVSFAANEAAHDAGNLYWPSMETRSRYYEITGEHAYDTANEIMDKAITYCNITVADSSVEKIDKILRFINSEVTYQSKLLDHMWFPTETLTFKSGDCTSFSILAACMFEKLGIKAAIGFFTYQNEGHAMVLVRLNDLESYGYVYHSSLTSYGLLTGRWIVIEPQFSSLSQYSSNLGLVQKWNIVAASEVPYGA